MFGKKETYTVLGSLIDGLPAAQGSPTLCKLENDGLHFTVNTATSKEQHFDLALDKIEDLQIMDEKTVKEVIEQSAPGMILGAAAFGAIGAMIGGRVKTKEKTKISYLFVIDYFSEEKKQIVIDISADMKNTKRLIEHFKELRPLPDKKSDPIQL